MANGWADLGRALAGGGDTERAYLRGATQRAQAEALIAEAKIKRGEADARHQLAGAITKLGGPADLATVMLGGFDPTKISGYTGDMQEQGFRGDAVARALAGDFDGANANLFGVASGPQALAAIQDQNLINNQFLAGGGGVSTTDQGRATIRQRDAAAAASRASAASSYATADSTQRRVNIAEQQFDLQRRGQWNPGGTAAAAGAGQKPLPVGALKPLLEVEDALGGTQLMADIIGKHTARLGSGELQLSPLAAALATGRTAVGFSTPNDVAINEWNADKTKIVNESLRLNKGVQTEGDAQRAANELMAANDAQTAARALERLAEINSRAVELQRRKRDLIMSNYGRATSAVDAFGGVGTAPTPAAAPPATLHDALGGAVSPPVRRARNPQTGQWVVLRNGQWVPE